MATEMMLRGQDDMLPEVIHVKRVRWIWPWKALREINRLRRENGELKHRNDRQFARLQELDGLCLRQQQALIEADRKPTKAAPKKGRRK